MSKKGKLYRKYGKAFNPQDLYSQFVTQSEVFDFGKLEDMLMKVKLENIQEKRIAYLTSENGYKLDSIYDTWDRILHWFPSSGYELDDYPPIFNYLNDSREDNYVEMDVYIKVKELISG